MEGNQAILYNTTSSHHSNLTTNHSENDFMEEATSHLMYRIGDGMNKFYFAILVPIGVLGNILSFLVMVQKHNRQMSISTYLSALAVTDTMSLLLAFTSYLNDVFDMDMPPNQLDYCRVATFFIWSSTLCSTLFILSMTFDRFYSIIRPHKAASFNTVKRAKITIVCIIIVSYLFNIPQLYIITHVGRICVPYLSTALGQTYHWLSYTLNFAIPFVSLLSMNCVVIHKLRTRLIRKCKNEGQGQSQGHMSRAEKNASVILLLVAFSFLILVSPLHVLSAYTIFVDYTKTPHSFAQFNLLYHFSHKLYFTNNGVNFFLYVISGQKFRSDLVNLFRCD